MNMLIYLNGGLRNYRDTPSEPFIRNCWEFQAVLSGSIALDLPKGRLKESSKSLWVFHPKLYHGWISSLTEAEIVVFHFDEAPTLLHSAINEDKGYVRIELSEDLIHRLRALYQLATSHRIAKNSLDLLVQDQILTELSVMLLKNHVRPIYDGELNAQSVVDQAIAYFTSHMSNAPSLDHIASVLHISRAHLRRQFYKVKESSPKNVLDTMRFQRAGELMLTQRFSFDDIALQCGYSDANCFFRAFRSKLGQTPTQWLKNQLR